MAFRATSRLMMMAESSGMSRAKQSDKQNLKKWWSFYVPQEGVITRHRSAFQQDAVMPLWKTLHANAARKFKDHAWFAIPPIIFGICVVKGTAYTREQMERSHRD